MFDFEKVSAHRETSLGLFAKYFTRYSFNMFGNLPISGQCSLSVSLENFGKPLREYKKETLTEIGEKIAFDIFDLLQNIKKAENHLKSL